MGKIKRRCAKKKKWKSEKVVVGRSANLPNQFQLSLFFFFPKFFLILFGILEFEKRKRRKMKYAVEKEKNKMADFWRG
jgi:hypothetical protein